jgi:hypothetical protein
VMQEGCLRPAMWTDKCSRGLPRSDAHTMSDTSYANQEPTRNRAILLFNVGLHVTSLDRRDECGVIAFGLIGIGLAE